MLTRQGLLHASRLLLLYWEAKLRLSGRAEARVISFAFCESLSVIRARGSACYQLFASANPCRRRPDLLSVKAKRGSADAGVGHQISAVRRRLLNGRFSSPGHGRVESLGRVHVAHRAFATSRRWAAPRALCERRSCFQECVRDRASSLLEELSLKLFPSAS